MVRYGPDSVTSSSRLGLLPGSPLHWHRSLRTDTSFRPTGRRAPRTPGCTQATPTRPTSPERAESSPVAPSIPPRPRGNGRGGGSGRPHHGEDGIGRRRRRKNAACNGHIVATSCYILIYLFISGYVWLYLSYPTISGTDFANIFVQGRAGTQHMRWEPLWPAAVGAGLDLEVDRKRLKR